MTAAGRALDLGASEAYARWRATKLAGHPGRLEELVVEVRDPRRLAESERGALLERCARANMALYASTLGRDPDKEIPRQLGLQLGLSRMDANYLADDDGISPIAVAAGGKRAEFIPYTNRAIRWHTDGYYNPPGRAIRAFLLHCVEEAQSGGENGLLDPEIIYILLRDEDPEHVRALMAGDAMTIPARGEEGAQDRPAQGGPVFSVDPEGHLHMRYTARSRSIQWKDDRATGSAVRALEGLLAGAAARWAFRAALKPGWGLVCNNVLHDRRAFSDSDARRRLLYRVRYHDRVASE